MREISGEAITTRRERIELHDGNSELAIRPDWGMIRPYTDGRKGKEGNYSREEAHGLGKCTGGYKGARKVPWKRDDWIQGRRIGLAGGGRQIQAQTQIRRTDTHTDTDTDMDSVLHPEGLGRD